MGNGKINHYVVSILAPTYGFSAHWKKHVPMTIANCPIPHLLSYHRLSVGYLVIGVCKKH